MQDKRSEEWKNKKSDFVKSDLLTIFKRIIASASAAKWTFYSEKLRVRGGEERLHLAYYLYLNRKIKSEVKGQESLANGH